MEFRLALSIVLGTWLAMPALAQVTDTCAGPPAQPVLDGNDVGDQALQASGAGFSANQNTSGAGCVDITGGHIDSVFCFRPTLACQPSFILTNQQPNAGAALNVRQFSSGEVCSDAPTGCQASGVDPNQVVLTNVNLVPTDLVCVYGAWVGAQAVHDTQGLTACGPLPVELESFQIQDVDASSSED